MDQDDELYFLQLVFLPRIDKDCQDFCELYNQHRIEGHGIPTEVFIKGCYDVFGIDSPRLGDFNVAQVDVQGDDPDVGSIRDEELEPIVRNVSLSCSLLRLP